MLLVFVLGFSLVRCSQKKVREDDLIDRIDRNRYVPEAPEAGLDPLKLDLAFFAFDSSELTDHAREVLRKHAGYLKGHPTAVIQIEGYCDTRGSHDYNLRLGERRAESAKAFLVQQGIHARRISTFSYGRVADGDPKSWQANRRAGFLVIYPKPE
jgi:outer membrane protein OmpA-like peptidoglycan-associated protein